MLRLYSKMDKAGDAGGADGAGAAAGAVDDDAKAAAAAAGASAGAAKADFPDDWRQLLAGEDADYLKRLDRYTSPKAMADALIAAQNKIRSGELKAPTQFPVKGTDEEKATWRKDNGLPEAPDKYDLKFESGLVIGDDDKPTVDKFLAAAHADNLAPSAVKTAVKWYFDEREARIQEQQESDATLKEATEDALRAEWGGDYKRNLAMVKGLVQMAPPEISDQIMHARMPGGVAIFNDPNVLRWLSGIARVVNPAATVVPGDGQAAHDAISDEITKLEKMMGDKRSAYWKGNDADKNQARYRDLVTARDRMTQK